MRNARHELLSTKQTVSANETTKQYNIWKLKLRSCKEYSANGGMSTKRKFHFEHFFFEQTHEEAESITNTKRAF